MFATHLIDKPQLATLHETVVAPGTVYEHKMFPGERVGFLVGMNLNSPDTVLVPTVTHTLGAGAIVTSYLGYFFWWNDGDSPSGASPRDTQLWYHKPSGHYWSLDPLIPCADIGTAGSPGSLRSVALSKLGESRSEAGTPQDSLSTGAARFWVIMVDLPTTHPPSNTGTITVSFQGESVVVPVHIGTEVVDYRFPAVAAYHDALVNESWAGQGITTNAQKEAFVKTLDDDWKRSGIANYYAKEFVYGIGNIYEHAFSINGSATPGHERHYWSLGDDEAHIPQKTLDYYSSLVGKHSYVTIAHMNYRFWSCDNVNIHEIASGSTPVGETVPVGDILKNNSDGKFYTVNTALVSSDTIDGALAANKISRNYIPCPSGWRYMQPGGHRVDDWDMADPNNPGALWARAVKKRLETAGLWDQFNGWVIHFDEPHVASLNTTGTLPDRIYTPKPYADQATWTRRAMKIMKVYYDAGFTVGIDCPNANVAQLWIHDNLWSNSGLLGEDGTLPVRMIIMSADDRIGGSAMDVTPFIDMTRQIGWSTEDVNRYAIADAARGREMIVSSYYTGLSAAMDLGTIGLGHVLPYMVSWCWKSYFHLNYSVGKMNTDFANTGDKDTWKDQWHNGIGGTSGYCAIYPPYLPGASGPAITDTFITSMRFELWKHGLNLVRRLEKWGTNTDIDTVRAFVMSTMNFDANVLQYMTTRGPVHNTDSVPFSAQDPVNYRTVEDRVYLELDTSVPSTDPPVTIGFPILSATNNLVGQVRLTWTPVPTATSYVLWYRENQDPISWSSVEVGTSSHLFTLAVGEWEFKVDAKNVHGSTTMHLADGVTETIIGESIGAAIVHPPTTTLTDRITVTWDSVVSATRYKVWWRKADESDAGWSSQELGVVLTYDIMGVDVGVDYKIRVDSGTPSWSQMQPLDQIGRIDDPSLTSPPDTSSHRVLGATQNLTDRITLSWEAVPRATYYKLWWRRLDDSNAWQSLDTATAVTSHDFLGLTPDVVWKFNVDAGNAYGTNQMTPTEVQGLMPSAIVVERPDVNYHHNLQPGPGPAVSVVSVKVSFTPLDDADHFGGWVK